MILKYLGYLMPQYYCAWLVLCSCWLVPVYPLSKKHVLSQSHCDFLASLSSFLGFFLFVLFLILLINHVELKVLVR